MEARLQRMKARLQQMKARLQQMKAPHDALKHTRNTSTSATQSCHNSKDFPKFRSGKAKSNLSQDSYLFFGLNVNVFLVISKIWCILIQKVFKMAFAPLKISGENDANKTFTVCKQIMRNISKCCKLFLVDSTFILILELIIWIHNNENILFRVSKEGMTQRNEPFLLFLAWENWASKEDWK